jgi:asparagine synthase (glutamine-hydrolysing)
MLSGAFRIGGGSIRDLGVARAILERGTPHDEPEIDEPGILVDGSGHSTAVADGIHCVLDGHLHEPEVLAERLGLRPASDPELVARAYRRGGLDLLSELRGRFAAVLWDSERRTGTVVTDPLATQPVFFKRGAGHIAFAAELIDLLRILPAGPGPDSVGFVAWLSGLAVPEDRTLYQGVSRLPPGHALQLAGSAEVRRYWEPRYRGTMKGSRRDLAEGLREQVERAVARRLSPRCSGVVLSGGLDSSIVTASASRTLRPGARLQTYSAAFPGAEYDESWKVRSLTGALGLEPALFELEPQGALWLGLTHLKHCGLPLIGVGGLIDAAMVGAAARDGAEVVLDGQTGDELFGLSPWVIADRLGHGRLLGAFALARSWPRGRPTTWRERRFILEQWGLKGLAPYRLHRLRRDRRDADDIAPSWLRPDLRRRYAELEDPWAWKAGSSSGPRWWRFQADRLTHAPHRELRLDYMRHRAAAAGVVGEPPLYDLDLIDYCLRLPPELAFDSALDRPLAREAVRGLIPDDVRLNGRKAVFSPFCFDALTGADSEGIGKLLTDPDAELGAFADLGTVRSLWSDHRPGAGADTMSWGTVVWRLAAAECWLRAQADPTFIDEMLAHPAVRPPRVRPAAGTPASTFPEPTFSGLSKPEAAHTVR